MRILSVHNYYQYRGGEDVSHDLEAEMLRKRGHVVFDYVVDNAQITSRLPLSVGFRAIWSDSDYRAVRKLIRAQGIEMVKIDNFFPLLSPSIHNAAWREGVPVVQIIRDYRLICPEGRFIRDEKICQLCSAKAFPLSSLVHGCYRSSRVQTAAVVGMLTVHRLLRTWSNTVTAYIAVSEFVKHILIDNHFPADRVCVKPDFVPDVEAGPGGGDYALFVGRLSPEKGLSTLLQAWQRMLPRLHLKIVGDGPLRPEVEQAAQAVPDIQYLGPLPIQDVLTLMGRARVLLFSSIGYETFGRTIVEAFAKGLPVITTRLGNMDAMVEEYRTGLKYEPGNPEDLLLKIGWMRSHPQQWEKMRTACRETYLENYTEERNYAMLMKIFENALATGPVSVRRQQSGVRTVLAPKPIRGEHTEAKPKEINSSVA